jgi:hypothetical protein
MVDEVALEQVYLHTFLQFPPADLHSTIAACHHPLRRVIALTSIRASSFKLRASSFSQHLAGNRGRKFFLNNE